MGGLGICPGCHRHCALEKARCNMGKKVAARRREELQAGVAWVQDEELDMSLDLEQPDYGQHHVGYDPEGLADPEAHNVRPSSWDIDWDL